MHTGLDCVGLAFGGTSVDRTEHYNTECVLLFITMMKNNSAFSYIYALTLAILVSVSYVVLL